MASGPLSEWRDCWRRLPSLRRKLDAILHRFSPRRMRAALRAFTIGACDLSKAERLKRRKECARLREQARRRGSGAKPREQSFNQTKP